MDSCPISYQSRTLFDATECSTIPHQIDSIPYHFFSLTHSRVDGRSRRPRAAFFVPGRLRCAPAPPAKVKQAYGPMAYRGRGSFLEPWTYGFHQRPRCVQVKKQFGAENGMAAESGPFLTGLALDG